MKVGIIAPDLRETGGVREKTLFVARALRDQLDASIRVVSLATSRSDPSSILLGQPHSWTRSLTSRYAVDELEVQHVGAVCGEIELARYVGRRALLNLVAECDAVHVVCGTPAFANAVSQYRGRLIVHFASFVRHERLSARQGGVHRWRDVMTSAVTLVERAALRRADAIIAVNRTRLQEAQALARPGTSAAVIHTGVDTDRFSPGPYRGDGYLLTVGRLNDPRKNVPLLLRAYAVAVQQAPSLPRLVLTGPTEPRTDEWGLVSALGLSDRVSYTGPLDRRALVEIYRGASAFVLSSDEEGQGIALVEAMACGLPIVATSCVGPCEVVSHGVEGLLCPVGSVNDLADAMVHVNADPERRRDMSHAARARAVREFSLERTSADLCGVYRSCGIAHTVAKSPHHHVVSQA
jgi:glycosyltransferase involved in cell wall biosynthesis